MAGVPLLKTLASRATGFLLVFLIPSCAIAGLVRAQSIDAAWDWNSLHRDGQRPDYLAAFAVPGPELIPIPPPPVGGTPAVVRGLYVNGWVFGSRRFYDLVRLADSTEINAMVIDVKDGTGHMTYRSNVPTAITIGANNVVRAPDVRRRLAILREHGIHPIARIVVAKDPLLASRKTGWAIHDIGGGLWVDGLRSPWVDAYQDSVWIYAAEIAAEAVLLGFAEVQFDYVRFPDEPQHLLDRAVYPARQFGESRRAAITRQLARLGARIKKLRVPFTIDVFGLTTSATGDVGVGQYWDDIAQLADVILPMVYPSHYQRGAYGFRRPNFHPYDVVLRALGDAIRRSSTIRDPARIRPYLQSFTLGRPRYKAAEVRAQIEAVEDLGLTDWVLWNSSGLYPPGALRANPNPRPAGVELAAPNTQP